MKKSDQLRLTISQKLDQAQTIVDNAEAAGRALTADEESQWQQIMAAGSGEIEQLQGELQMAIVTEEKQRAERMSRIANLPPTELTFDSTGARPYLGGPNLVEPKLATFKGPQASRDAFDASLWLRGCVLGDGPSRQKLESRRPAWLASMSEASPTSGGYTVPAEFSRAIFDYRDEVGVARKLATVLPMGSDNVSVPKLDSGPTAYVIGEESQITSSDAAFSQVTLQPKKRAVLSYVSSELADDNAVGLMDLLAQRMGLALAVEEDRVFINGTGIGSDGGVIGCKTIFSTATAGVVQAATNNDTWPEITYADIALAMAKVASQYRTGGELAFLVSSAAKWQVLDRLILAQGGATAGNLAAGVGVNSFAGYPVYTSDYLPTTTATNTIFLLFGNFKLCSLFGNRLDLRIDVSPHLKFDYDQIAIRAITRFDVNHHEFGDASTAGGVVALKTAS